ncbi:hypothetical protein D3C71_24290 [compost metagenome]
MSTKKPLLLNFKPDTRATVSRETLQKLAEALGVTETLAVHIALARLRDELLVSKEELVPLTESQHQAIANAEPPGRGKVIDSLLR